MATNTEQPIYYTVYNEGMIELRQERFRVSHFERGVDHPHDVCAVARSNEEMQEMIISCKMMGAVDYSRTA